MAIAIADKKYGPSPVSVVFKGNTSYDPDGQPLTYLWNFGDGSSSTLANPSHTFTAPASAPAKYTVTLTVKDIQGISNSTSLLIHINNTPPVVTITSPANGTLYPMTGETTYNLSATVTDKEHSSSQLFYKWQTILHHDKHEHPEPVDTARKTTTVITPLGCGAETYYYQIALTVTDAEGLSTYKEVNLYPACSANTKRIKQNNEEAIELLKNDQKKIGINEEDIFVSYFPNPFKSQFSLYINAKEIKKMPVKIFDISGRLILLTEVQTGQRISVGKQLAAGEYILEVGQGIKAKRSTLLKIY